ncbi:MAG: hypothetical protein LBT46_08160, partial [Planctomycetaceae bacterium]|nr:hypothetical protein [Planctomycetaceae bacterium]
RFILHYCLSAYHLPPFAVPLVNFTFTALFLASVTALVHYQKPLFWKTQESPDIPCLSVQESYLSVGGLTFFLALLSLAPLTTVVAFQFLAKRINPHSDVFSLACQIYDRIAAMNDWLPYPQLESQRNVVRLLAAAGLVRIAKRFGKIQVQAKQ